MHDFTVHANPSVLRSDVKSSVNVIPPQAAALGVFPTIPLLAQAACGSPLQAAGELLVTQLELITIKAASGQ